VLARLRDRTSKTARGRKLARALRLLLSDDTAVHTDLELAALVGCSDSTLQRHWKSQGFCGATELSLRMFVDLVQLLKARSRKDGKVKWVAAAETCGDTKRHLKSLAKRRLGRWPREHEPEAWLACIRLVRSWQWPGAPAENAA
jgi:hypothetical protein